MPVEGRNTAISFLPSPSKSPGVGLSSESPKLTTATALFATAYPLSEDLCRDPVAVERFVRAVGDEIWKVYGASDFLADRLNRETRRAAGIEMGHRAYNRRFRLLARLEAKVTRLAREVRKRELQVAGKSGLASRLPWDEFADAMRTQAPRAVVTMGQNGPRIHRLLQPVAATAGFMLRAAEDLAEAMEQGRAALRDGGVLLLSPGAPSFGAYRDYVARGRDFARLAGFDPEAISGIGGMGIA